MIILSIETSCDETAVSLLQISGSPTSPKIKILGNALYSQVKIHEKYGGVYPNLAKREHQKNLIPLLKKVLKESGSFEPTTRNQRPTNKLQKILEREAELLEQFLNFVLKIKKPRIDAIAVTEGPGLEPALWVGINFARALGEVWNVPVVPVNHMEGHFMSVLWTDIADQRRKNADKRRKKKRRINYPVLALLISGGHTELVYSKIPHKYRILGETRDDAVGEAFDKVARLLGLPYPGGPAISRLAEQARNKAQIRDSKSQTRSKSEIRKEHARFVLPRPMLNSPDYDFSFSGLKTAVLYLTEGKKLSAKDMGKIAREFEDAVTEVLVKKTAKALASQKVKTLIIAGGVVANKTIRKSFQKLALQNPKIKLYIPTRALSTDNSIMIGIAGYARIKSNPKLLGGRKSIRAQGKLRLSG